MTAIYLSGAALIGPGLNGWQQAAPILRGEQPYQPAPLAGLAPALLPANERRRATTTIKLALQVAHEAMQDHDADHGLQFVFVSSLGDSHITDKICRALAQPERPVSPTHFHNSVHNAPAGYFAIAARSQAPSLSIAAGQASFGIGLLEAVAQVATERENVLLIAYDSLPPEPIREKSGIDADFAAALLLTPQPVASTRCRLDLTLDTAATADRLDDPALERLRQSNPMACSLPLLAALARGGGEAHLPYLDERALRVVLRPC